MQPPIHCKKINTGRLKILFENSAITQLNPNVDEFTKDITRLMYMEASRSTRESKGEVDNQMLERWERSLE